MATYQSAFAYKFLLRQKLADGTWRTVYNLDIPDYFLLTYGKTSINTGRFTPGVYRVNPYSVYREDAKVSDLTFYGKYTYYGDWEFAYSGQILGGMVWSIRDTSNPSALDQLASEALQKAYAKLGQGAFNIGADLGEIRETLEMLKSPLSAIYDFLYGGNRKNVNKLKKLLHYLATGTYGGSSGARALKLASNAWLEFRYGWSPLVRTLGTLLEAAQSKRGELFDPQKIRSVRSSASSTINGKGDGWFAARNCTIAYTYNKQTNLTARAAVQYRQSVPLTAAQELGISPRHIPEIAWELTRLSFVWDWFLTIGPWLQGFRIKPEITVLGSTVGKKIDRSVTANAEYLATGYGDAPKGRPCKGDVSYTYKSYNRVVGSVPPLTPVFRVGDVIDLNKIVDSLTLIIQRIVK